MQQNTPKVCVIGLGYIGLPTASLLATKGFSVVGVDVNQNVVSAINRGEVPIYEPDLDILVKSAVKSEKLTAKLEPCEADIFIIAVPTPFRENHQPDISYVESATRSIAKVVRPGNLVILESTSPVGTTEKMSEWILETRKDLEIPVGSLSAKTSQFLYLAHCPERVLPGQILRELVDNDRVVGGVNPASTLKAEEFYASFVSGKILKTNARTAEMTKLTENAFRDVNIAFANELSLICDQLEINTWDLIALANHHPRVNILQPGPGVGGHCIAVDPWFIVSSAPDSARLIRTARLVNDSKPHYIVNRIIERAKRFRDPVIACLGLSFKANIDDLRESPAVEIVHELAEKKLGRLLVVEPHIEKLPSKLASVSHTIELTDLATALKKSDVVALLVDHKEFKSIDAAILQEKVTIDTRGIFHQTFERNHFKGLGTAG